VSGSLAVRGLCAGVALAALLVACRVEGDLGGVRPPPPCDAACDDACVDLATDRAHCGACGVACGVEERCAAGACVTAWPKQWRMVAQTRPGDRLNNRWDYTGGGCLLPVSIPLPEGGTALSLRADWGRLSTNDPSELYGALARAWVWRLQFDPPERRRWGASGFARTRLGLAGGVDRSGVGFQFDSRRGEHVEWVVDGAPVRSTPFPMGRMVELRVEVTASRTRARALLDGAVEWEGATDGSDWSERDVWSLNVFREGGFAGCDQGRFLVAELRAEVSP
jgi:hypothetical protein